MAMAQYYLVPAPGYRVIGDAGIRFDSGTMSNPGKFGGASADTE